MEQDDP
jgi:hypothetical protein